MIVLSQRDPRWSSKKLGFGNTTIHSYGCTITAIASLLNTTPDAVNDRLKAVNGFAGTNGNLVVWSKLIEAFDEVVAVERVRQYDNAAVSAAIEKNGGCLVEVNGSSIGAPKHWVLYIGDKKIMDPWYGTIRSTGDYPAIGYAIITLKKTSPTNPPAAPEPSRLLEYLGSNTDMEARKKLAEHLGEWDAKCDWGNEQSDRGGFLGSARREINKLRRELSRARDDASTYREDKNSLEIQTSELIGKVNQLTEERDVLQAQYDALQRKMASHVCVCPEEPPKTSEPQAIPQKTEEKKGGSTDNDSYSILIGNYKLTLLIERLGG